MLKESVHEMSRLFMNDLSPWTDVLFVAHDLLHSVAKWTPKGSVNSINKKATDCIRCCTRSWAIEASLDGQKHKNKIQLNKPLLYKNVPLILSQIMPQVFISLQ